MKNKLKLYQKLQGINEMGLSDPYEVSYEHNWIETSNLHHQTFISLIWTTVFCSATKK